MANRRVSSNKDVEKLARQARRQGWTVEVTQAGHVKWVSPEGRVMHTGMSMSSQRRIRGVLRELVALGFRVSA